MKTFPKKVIGQNHQVTTSSVNDNIEQTVSEFNGNLDGTNMPVDSVTHSNFKDKFVPVAGLTGGMTRQHQRGPTQSYHQSKIYSGEHYGTDVWTPLLSIDLDADNWRRGWNNLHDFARFSEMSLTFPAREGMVTGVATIDWHHGINRVTAPNSNKFTGNDWWTEWGVFVNNVKVAQSSYIYPRRHTTMLPFSIPVGSGPVTIDVRFKMNTSRDYTTSNKKNDTPFDIFSVDVFARNTYR